MVQSFQKARVFTHESVIVAYQGPTDVYDHWVRVRHTADGEENAFVVMLPREEVSLVDTI